MERNKKHLCYEQDGNKWFWWWNTDVGKRHYSTSSRGDGVFEVDDSTGDMKQLVGSCQFSLNGLKNPKAKIRKWMKE